MSEFDIRRVSERDNDELAACAVLFTEMINYHAEAVPKVFLYPGPTKTADSVAQAVRSSDGVFVALLAGQVVGALHAVIKTTGQAPGWRERTCGYVERVFVEPGFRRRGIGRALVVGAESWLKSEGIVCVELNTWQFNEGALAFFNSVGYVVKNVNFWRKI
ncbi:MAG: GNAT family N-acetyltransferase [Actinobacteria bacterium]|nr:GNAT family N-acetyltransferase [Actinomycetota bacterium]